jgi:hypothetical protein
MSDTFQSLLTQAQARLDGRLPLRRKWAAKVAGWLPAASRFRVCGLPGAVADAGVWKSSPVTVPQRETPAFLASVENGIACDGGAHLTREGWIIPELSPGAPEEIMAAMLAGQRMNPEIPHRAGPLISLAQSNDRNFLSWMYEVLPRWRIIKSSRLNSSGGLYACLLHRFQRESLNLLGLVPSRVADSMAQPLHSADVLHVPSYVSRDEPWITQWLRDSLLAPALKQSSLHTRKRIYISRRESPSRHITNAKEVAELLKKFEFTEISMKDYSLAGQIALFHAAQAIVAPHGTGLTNLAFSESDTFVLELTTAGSEPSFYEAIARQRGLHYQSLDGTPVDPSNPAVSDLTVDLDALQARLSAL